jgi:branched-chain amino acid transport system substrate-binding protein
MIKSRFLALLAVASATALAPARAQQLPDAVKIGFVSSLTGGNASYGVSGLEGAKLAVDEINKSGGIGGKQIRFIIADDQTDAAKGLAEAIRLTTRENVHAVVGPIATPIVLAAGNAFTEANILNVSAAGSATLTPQRLPYHFSFSVTSELEGVMMIDYAADTLKAKSVAWLSDTTPVSRLALAGARAEAEKRGVQLVAVQEYDVRSEELTPQILSLRKSKADVLLMRPSSGEDHGLIMKTLNDIGWSPRVVNGNGTSATVSAALKVYPDAYKGIVNLAYRAWSYCPSDAVGQTPLGKFKTKLKDAVGADTYGKVNQNFAAQQYDAVYLIKAAMEGTKSTNGKVLAQWIEQKAGNVKGMVSGAITASPTSHFLLSSREGMAFEMNPDKPRADGLFQRVGCN